MSIINPNATFNINKKIKDLPIVNLPLIKTLISTRSDFVNIEIVDKNRKLINLVNDSILTYKIDPVKQIIRFQDGKEFKLDTLNDYNSRTGKSIDKADAVELANKYLKLAIPSKSKKIIFVNEIRKKLGLELE
jgi:hypothetical protein